MDLLQVLEDFFQREAPLDPGDGIVVAFSGGPDSSALLWGLSRLASGRQAAIVAAHLDHGLDGGSAARAAEAARLAERLAVPLIAERREVPRLRRSGESREAAARRLRYDFLERVRRQVGARYVATAHHRDDQAETVLLRLLFGSGIAGLSAIQPRQGAVVRPLLELPRAALAHVAAAALAPLKAALDPTNADLRSPRNRIRHLLLPALGAADPDVVSRLAALAAAARRAAVSLDRRVLGAACARGSAADAAIDRGRFARLPGPLAPFALAALHRRAGAPHPPGRTAQAELLRQLDHGGHVGCDCGGGWRWQVEGNLLTLRQIPREETALRRPAIRRSSSPFTYTLEIPGELEVPELAIRIRLSRRPVAPWMLRGAARAAVLALPLRDGDRVTVRNRRPGDRLRPLGSAGSRLLKEILIDRHVPREQRERLPLLCVGEHIAWVPGVTIDHRFRIAGQTVAWVAEVVPAG
ncbi:MAG TPA: tRNA lysidine(34) synthetase TilS [Thermoanaerobaculia bacterium]|nr:tRNA lysidine(34) synthetase TilS [Thermoanaerobaculia bacterium]